VNLGVVTVPWTHPSRPLRRCMVSSALLAILPLTSKGQNIATVAGGGPNDVPALSVSISPTSIARDASGNLYIADPSFNFTRVFKVTPAGQLTVVAGNGVAGFSGDGGPATNASLNFPVGVFVDSQGNIFIADLLNNRVREIDASTGNIRTVAGDGTQGFAGDGGPATGASLAVPNSVSVDSLGDIFIADSGNSRIREVVVATGKIQTVAGGGTSPTTCAGSTDSIGDGCLATSASLNHPNDVTPDSVGNIFIADSSNSRIREVVAATGKIQTVGGGGLSPATCTGSTDSIGDGCLATSASLSGPNSVSVDSVGNIFIADFNNSRIREVVVSTGKIQTVAGGGPSPATCAGSTDSIGDGCLATSASLSGPEGVLVDGSGNILIADSGNGRVREVVTATGDITTIAGNGAKSFGGDGHPAIDAELDTPVSVLVDGSGNIFIADSNNNRVREVAASSGNIQTVAGNGTPGFSGDGGPATGAELNLPFGLAVDSQGNLFIADLNNSRIREVVASTGNIQTVAGNGVNGFSGDGGPATNASLNFPEGVFVDSQGNIFIADTINNRIREVVKATLNIQTVAGDANIGFTGDGVPATSTALSSPFSVFADKTGNLFIGDSNNSRIREVLASTGNIQTVAGNGTPGFSGDGGLATSAQLNGISGISVDDTGNLFIVDSADNRIREVESSTGNIQTVVGNGVPGFNGDGGPAATASLRGPFSVFVDGVGNIFIGDSENNRIRAVFVPAAKLSGATLSFTPQDVGTSSVPQIVTLTNSGRAILSISSIAVAGTNSADFSQTNNCAATVNIGANCTINVKFSPISVGVRTASVIITDNAGNSPQTVSLTGAGVVAAPTVSSASLTFAAQGVGSLSAAQTVTLTNNGNATLSITSIAITGASASDFSQTNTCGVSVAVGANCAINVSFKPTASGMLAASVTITDDAANSPQNISISGTATDFSFNVPQASATVTAGQTASFSFQLSATGAQQTVSLTCGGAPQEATCMVPSTVKVTPGTAATVNVSVSTTGRSLLLPRVPVYRNTPKNWPALLSLVALLLLLLRSWTKRTIFVLRQMALPKATYLKMTLQAVLLLASIAFFQGCGGGGSSTTPPPGNNGTPAGTSTLTVTATSNGESHSTLLTLTVQ
jgi:sugar lactone lactonase YvrE